VYADEGHMLRDPANVLDATRREVAWFDRFLGNPRQAEAR
jgi:dipeptidyl aminopeptidase/acylaminoacyl peptidase